MDTLSLSLYLSILLLCVCMTYEGVKLKLPWVTSIFIDYFDSMKFSTRIVLYLFQHTYIYSIYTSPHTTYSIARSSDTLQLYTLYVNRLEIGRL